ncbi:GON-4-like protein [Lineus longissimus]|uniref:GON-4-like protein n=1 Tax=Lineus longissimus TaxID=88925 RepID=UPI002B4CEC37
MSEMHGEKRKTGGEVSRNVKVPKTSTDAKPWGSPHRRNDDKQATSSSQERRGTSSDLKKSGPVPSTSHDSARKSLKYGNVASVKRRLISPKEGEKRASKNEKSGHTPPGNTLSPHRTSLQRTPPHLRKYFLRSPIKTSPLKGASLLTTPVKSPLRRTIKSPGQSISPQRSGHMWRRLPNRNSRECSPYKLRSPARKTTTPGKSNKSKHEDELNLSSDAGLEHLKLLSEQLSSLNQDSGALTTAMYDSEHRKQTPDKTKRTPGKLRTSDKDNTEVRKSRSPARSLPSTSKKSISPLGAVDDDDDDDMWDSCDSDDSTELNIVEPDLDLEAVLDTQADKNKLTVLNVKNILHHVITNEHVVAMVRSKLLKEDPTDKSFEPKMTRSKVKEIMETGQMPHPWPISPIKKQEKEKPVTIMELSFSDEEDDEYDPQKDPPVCDSDGEDSESFISLSQTSEFGSPCPTTPSTPKLWPAFARDDDTPKGRGSTPVQLMLSPQGLMGPPLPPSHLLSNLRTRLNDIPSVELDEEDEETIATRTRSKLPLTDTPLDEIESNFVAPDITPDLYDTQCDDKEWGFFLTGLMKTGDPDLNDTLDDEQNDPEYNFLAEEEDDDEDEMRDDRAVKVSKKELNELLDELFEAYGGADILDDEEADTTLTPSYNVPAPMKLNESQKAVVMVEVEQEERKNDIMEKLPDQIPVISATEKQQLDDQMRKHTQLLLQVGVLAVDTPGLESPANTCRFLLNELQRFATHSPAGMRSVFNTFNLSSANEAMQSYTRHPGEESPSDGNSAQSSSKKVNVRNATSPEQLDIHQKRWFALCDACIYPRLLPLAKFHPPHVQVKDKPLFTDAETNLLALAVGEFQHMASYIRLIQYYMMPAKTEEQLKTHIKNKVAKRAPDNPIKQAKQKKIRPMFPCTIDPFDANHPNLPIDHPKEVMPRWLQKLKKLSEWRNLRKERQYARKKQQRLDKKMAMKISNVELTDNVREHLKKKKETPLSPGVRTRCMSKKDSIKSTVMAKITTRGARKKLSETFGTSYDDIELPQDVPSTSHSSTSLECDETLDDLESSGDNPGSMRDNSGSISEVSMESSVSSSSDSDLDSDSDKDASGSKRSPTTTDAVIKCDLSLRKIQPAGGNPLLNLPLITVCVNPQGPPLASEAETSRAQQVARNPIPQAVQPIQAYMQAADADPPVAPVRQAVMPAAEAAQPKVPDIAVVSGSNENVSVPVSISSPNQIPNGTPLKLIASGSAQAILVCSPAQSILGSATKSNDSQTPPPRTPPALSSPSVTSSPSVILTPGNQSGFVTPNKKYPLIAPKSSLGKSENKVSPFIDKPGLKYRGRPSPKIKRRLVNRSIQPKGIIVNAFISPAKSPTKKAADSIKARLRRKPRPILPKLQMQMLPESTRTRPALVTPPREGFSDEDYASDEDGDLISSPVVDETSDFLDSEIDDNVGDSQGEEEAEDGHLAELMAASTTISTKRPRKNPLMEKRALTDAVFASNIVEIDPLRDDRDTAFARAYLTRVKQAMKSDPENFERFVQILAEFGEDGEKSPVQLYPEVCELLKPYPDLLPDFATFLAPGEALECGCATDAEDFHRARAFLRKLEVHFQKHPNFFHKIVKALDTCRNGATEKLHDLQEMMKSLLRGQPHLLEEFMAFFPEDKPPMSHMTDFEEVTLEFSDDEPTPYETVKVPDKETTYGTNRCCCSCHGTSGAMRRKTHCRKCALAIIDGQLCLMTKNRGQGGATTVVFHKHPGQDHDDDSRQSGLSRRASLDSIGPGLSDIENMEDGAPEPHRRKRAHRNHKVLAELTDSSDQASNDAVEPGYFGLDNLPRNNVSGSLDEEDDDDDVDVDDLDDDDDDDEDDLADDEDDNNDDKEDLDEDDDVADDLDDIDDSDDNMDVNVDSDDDDEDDDFDPSAYIEEEENEENQSSEAVESPENSRIESVPVQIKDENRRASNDANFNGASRPLELGVDNFPEDSGKVGRRINSKSEMIIDETDGLSDVVFEPEGINQPKESVQPDGAGNSKGEERSISSGSDVAGDGNRHTRHTFRNEAIGSTWTRDEDTLILETCKHRGPTIRSFRLVSNKLKNRTTEQISERFNQLLDKGSSEVGKR